MRRKGSTKIVVLAGVLIIVAILISIWWVGKNQSKIRSECEIKDNCMLVYTGSKTCVPCNTSSEDFKCLTLEEATKIKDEREKQNIDIFLFNHTS